MPTQHCLQFSNGNHSYLSPNVNSEFHEYKDPLSVISYFISRNKCTARQEVSSKYLLHEGRKEEVNNTKNINF